MPTEKSSTSEAVKNRSAGLDSSVVPFLFGWLFGDSGNPGQNTRIFPCEENPLRRSSSALLPLTRIPRSFTGRIRARSVLARVLTRVARTAAHFYPKQKRHFAHTARPVLNPMMLVILQSFASLCPRLSGGLALK